MSSSAHLPTPSRPSDVMLGAYHPDIWPPWSAPLQTEAAHQVVAIVAGAAMAEPLDEIGAAIDLRGRLRIEA